MAIFNSYVTLPQGRNIPKISHHPIHHLPFNKKIPGTPLLSDAGPDKRILTAGDVPTGRPDKVDDFALLGMHLRGYQGVRKGQFLHGLVLGERRKDLIMFLLEIVLYSI